MGPFAWAVFFATEKDFGRKIYKTVQERDVKKDLSVAVRDWKHANKIPRPKVGVRI